jgi:hypothetical protein
MGTILLRVQGASAQLRGEEGAEDEAAKGISYNKMVRTYSSSSNRQSSFERQGGKRSASSQSEDKKGIHSINQEEEGDIFFDTVQY